jgi:hypothetical protein
MIRDAKFTDIPAIAQLMAEAHRRSIYAETATFDPVEAKQLCARALHRHGHTNNGGSLVLVSETDGEVRGFIIGLFDSVYPCLKEMMATDLLFIMAENASAHDAVKMVKRLVEWAESNPKVIEVHLGVTSAIGDWERKASLYERVGLTRCGAMFRREFDRSSATKEVRRVQNC